jgi:YD repeat-containing protein
MPYRSTHISRHLKAAATNACGRLLRVDDGTGYQTFAYDRLGNVAENIRAIALPFEDSVYNFRMLFEYDSWNRVQRIVYPDSEVVSYNYDLAGNPVATNLQSHLPRYCPICRKKMHESTIYKWYCKRQLIILC